MQPQQIIDAIVAQFDGVVPKGSWGETSLFYNPGRALPNGVYFCTIKQHDGPNDRASQLDRPGVFRLSIGLSRTTYEALFGARPQRPPKGGVVALPYDFAARNELAPHPVYSWMGWVQVLNPGAARFTELQPLLSEAYGLAVKKFQKKMSAP
jgi:hypothetical protein